MGDLEGRGKGAVWCSAERKMFWFSIFLCLPRFTIWDGKHQEWLSEPSRGLKEKHWGKNRSPALGPALGRSHTEQWHDGLQRIRRIQTTLNPSLEREEFRKRKTLHKLSKSGFPSVCWESGRGAQRWGSLPNRGNMETRRMLELSLASSEGWIFLISVFRHPQSSGAQLVWLCRSIPWYDRYMAPNKDHKT